MATDYNSKYSGEQVEALLDQVANGEVGGGETLTEEDIAAMGFTKNTGTYSKPSGGIPKSDLAEEVKGALRKAEQYTGTVTEIKVNGNNIGASGGVVDLGNLGTYSKPTTGIPKSDLSSDVQTSLEKADTAVQPADIKDEVYIADFTMYSLRTGMNSGTDVDCNIQALVTAMNANKVILVREDENLEGVHVLNGFAEDLLYFSIVDSSGNILWCDGVDYISSQGINARALRLQDWRKKQDALVSGENIKTINGESILGEGNIEISGGSGEVGPQGPQGDKGDKGDTGVGVQSVTQTTTSNADGGSNVVTVTLTDGTKSTFTIKNGTKGSSGTNGTNGKDGADGEDGATFTPSVDSAGNLSWTNNKGLTNPPTVNIKGPKGDKGDSGSGGGGSSSGSGKEYIVVEPELSPTGTEAYISDIMPNTMYIVSIEISTLNINEFSVSDALSDEYNVIFQAGMGGTTLIINSYDGIYWANGVIPTIDAGAVYELSIQRVNLGGSNYFNAVLTPFRYV